MLIQPIDLKMSVCIICTGPSAAGIKKTVESCFYLDHPSKNLIVVKDDFDKTQINPAWGKLVIGGTAITDMIDIGCKNAETDWVYFVLAGTRLQKRIDSKNALHVKSYKDVLFPVINRRWNFIDATLNGLLLNKKFHEEVGDFGSGNDLMVTKLIWADRALSMGVKFKAIVKGGNHDT
jgi:hypothetical protein